MDSNGPACTKTPTRHHESSGGASSLKVADVDEMTLFQECVDDFDGVLRSVNSHNEESERVTEGVFPMSVTNVAGHGRDAAVSMASSISDAQANIMPLPLVKDITAPNTSFFTSEVMEIEEPGINEDTVVANPPFDSLPHQIRKGIETVNSVMADLDTAMLCYDLPGCSNDANYSCSSVGKLPYDRNIPGVFSSIEKCPPEEVLRCQAKGTHELNFLSSEDEAESSAQPESKRNEYAPSLLDRIEEQLSFGEGDHCGGEEFHESDDVFWSCLERGMRLHKLNR
ncbi:hypothetical protein OSTOST_06302 [Ostertagia ostertagi]